MDRLVRLSEQDALVLTWNKAEWQNHKLSAYDKTYMNSRRRLPAWNSPINKRGTRSPTKWIRVLNTPFTNKSSFILFMLFITFQRTILRKIKTMGHISIGTWHNLASYLIKSHISIGTWHILASYLIKLVYEICRKRNASWATRSKDI